MARNATPTAERETNMGEDFLAQALNSGDSTDLELDDNSTNSPTNSNGSNPVPLNQRGQESQFKAQMRQMVSEGMSRTEVAKALNVKYMQVYAATKDMSPSNSGTYADGTPRTGGRISVTLPDGRTMSRQDYIRAEFAKGRKRVDIAKELDVAYQIVFQATKDAATPRKTASAKIVETPDGSLVFEITGSPTGETFTAANRAEADEILNRIKEEIKKIEDAKRTSIKPIEMTDGGLKFEVKVGHLTQYASTRAQANEYAQEMQNQINEELGIEPDDDDDEENPEPESEGEETEIEVEGGNEEVDSTPDNS